MERLSKTGLGIVIALLLALTAQTAGATSRTTERILFQAAEQALKKNQIKRFESLKAKLSDYPLLPYLEYEALRQKLDHASPEKVERFLEKWKETPLAQMLRRRWLNLLAKRKDWDNYRRFYQKDYSVTRQCHYLNALIHTGDREKAFELAPELWLYGRSRPKACDPVFIAWRKSGKLTTTLVWQRIELAMYRGRIKLVRYLQRLLPQKDRPWADLWISLRRKPELALKEKRLRQPHPMRDAMLTYAVKRRSYFDPYAGWKMLRTIEKLHPLPESLHLRALQTLARAFLRVETPTAWHFFRSLKEAEKNTRLAETRVLAALVRGQWETALKWIDSLPDEPRWRYWKARSLEQIGQRKKADPIYRELAKERSYYGFLAADRVGLPYNLKHKPVPVDKETLAEVKKLPGIQRARELLTLGRQADARREWRMVTRSLPPQQAMAAAKLAQRWNWHDQAIFTLARTGYWDDLALRFPLEHKNEVEKRADERNLDPSWVFGLIRQESAFNPSVRSRVGALGLMQLMPATARYVARKLLKQPRPPKRHDLTTPDVNIHLGTTYLSDVMARMEQNPVLATAAYNAGPYRVTRWLPKHQLPADLWIELIPFKETRQYVKRVFTYAAIYDHRRGKEVQRLSQRLMPIAGDSPQRTALRKRNTKATM